MNTSIVTSSIIDPQILLYSRYSVVLLLRCASWSFWISAGDSCGRSIDSVTFSILLALLGRRALMTYTPPDTSV